MPFNSTEKTNRLTRWLLIGTFLPLCWFWMMITHETGHFLVAKLTGGTVTKVVLHPLAISRTEVRPNPHPFLVVWGGPLLGVILPLTAWGISHVCHWKSSYLFRFFAGFCCVANGAYVGIGSLEKIGDAGVMLNHDSSIWPLWLFGLCTMPLGFLLWHKLGVHFGLGNPQRLVNPNHATVLVILLIGTLIVSSLLSARL